MKRIYILLILLVMLFSDNVFSFGFTSSKIKSDEEVIFFPTMAWKSGDSLWTVHVHGWIFEPQTFGSLRKYLKKIGKRLDLGSIDQEAVLAKKRLHWFTVDNERGKYIRIRFGDHVVKLNKSKANGHFRLVFRLSDKDMRAVTGPDHYLRYSAVTRKKDRRRFSGRVAIIPEQGVSVISDIDDTIKISEVHDKLKLMQNTFVLPYRAVTGMNTLYRHWQSAGAHFHYLTSSPWQLYMPLSSFMNDSGFPAGSFHMKSFRIWDRTFFNVFYSSRKHKMKHLQEIFRRYPRRKFILVGDDGEIDPELYGEIARRHPQQVLHIFIRKTGNGIESISRYEKAFADIPLQRWTIFSDASKIRFGISKGR